MKRDLQPGEPGYLQWRKEHIEFWRRKRNGARLEVKAIQANRSSASAALEMVRVREVGRKTWQTWHPEYLRERATREES